jgi:hypothetical protein
MLSATPISPSFSESTKTYVAEAVEKIREVTTPFLGGILALAFVGEKHGCSSRLATRTSR